jgi:hypothetical protein
MTDQQQAIAALIEAPETIWATMPTDRALKEDTIYGWQPSNNTDDWDDWDDWGDAIELVEYRRADLPPTLSAAMELPEVRALVEALKWFEGQRQDALSRVDSITATEDDAVRAICERHGYGAVMDSAARQWAKKYKGAFFIGGCIGDKSAATALAPFTEAKQ